MGVAALQGGAHAGGPVEGFVVGRRLGGAAHSPVGEYLQAGQRQRLVDLVLGRIRRGLARQRPLGCARHGHESHERVAVTAGRLVLGHGVSESPPLGDVRSGVPAQGHFGADDGELTAGVELTDDLADLLDRACREGRDRGGHVDEA